jgi:methionyl-tRNA synthetase
VLADFVQEPVLLRKSFVGLETRLLFLDPSGAYVSQRAREEGIDVEELREKLRESVRRSKKYTKLSWENFINRR